MLKRIENVNEQSYGFCRRFSTVRQLSDLSALLSGRRSEDVGDTTGRLSSRFDCSGLGLGFHASLSALLFPDGSSKRRSLLPLGLQSNKNAHQSLILLNSYR